MQNQPIKRIYSGPCAAPLPSEYTTYNDPNFWELMEEREMRKPAPRGYSAIPFAVGFALLTVLLWAI